MGVTLPSVLQILDHASLRARVQHRSYWRLRYTDGRVMSEWDVDWSLAPHAGRQSLRLYCPSGQVAELGNSEDATGRLFQFKTAIVQAAGAHGATAQVIGVVDNADGDCQCAAWEYGPEQLTTFRDNVYQMQYAQVGLLNFDVLGLRF